MSTMQEDVASKKDGGYRDTIKVVVHALILALIVRTFFFQPFNIPSGSMKSTLLIGDYLFVSKFSYGYSKYSIPFSPALFSGRIWGAEPERGDVAVFRLPRDPSIDYIKRVIGLPGDEIQMIDGILNINGEPVPRERVEDFLMTNRRGRQVRAPRYRETLPNGVSYLTLDLVENGFADNTGVFKVPAGHYFMMGDNRDNSSDSRVQSGVGFVPLENFVGRADLIFFSIEEDASAWKIWEWPSTVRWGRLFSSVD
jgi:signal peptidase I